MKTVRPIPTMPGRISEMGICGVAARRAESASRQTASVAASVRMRMESIPVIEAKCLLVKEKREEMSVCLTQRDPL